MSWKNVLREYLVKIGIETNVEEFIKTSKLVNSTLTNVATYAKDYVSGLEKATKKAFHMYGYLIGTTAKLLNNTAELDRATEKSAKQYATTEQNIRSFDNALNLLNLSYQDLFFATERERQEFYELYNLGRQLEPPKALKETLNDIHAINLEINKFKTLLTYAQQWVVYFVGQSAGKELKVIREDLSYIFNWVKQNMPQIAKFGGQALGAIVGVVSAIVKLGRYAFDIIVRIINWLNKAPRSVRTLALTIAASIAIINSPLAAIIALLSLATFLVKDFMDWSTGQKSKLDWTVFQGFLEAASSGIDALLKALSDLLSFFGFASENADFSFLKVLQDLLDAIFFILTKVIQATTFLIKLLTAPFTIANRGFDQFVKDLGSSFDDLLDFSLLDRNRNNSYVTPALSAPNSSRTSNMSIDSHDTYNVNSIEEAGSLRQRNTKNIIDAVNSGMNPVFL